MVLSNLAISHTEWMNNKLNCVLDCIPHFPFLPLQVRLLMAFEWILLLRSKWLLAIDGPLFHPTWMRKFIRRRKHSSNFTKAFHPQWYRFFSSATFLKYLKPLNLRETIGIRALFKMVNTLALTYLSKKKNALSPFRKKAAFYSALFPAQRFLKTTCPNLLKIFNEIQFHFKKHRTYYEAMIWNLWLFLDSSALFERIQRPQNWCGPDRESEMDSTNDFPIRCFDCQKKTNPSIWWPIIMEKSHFPLKGPTQCKSLMKNFQIIDGNLLS